MSSAAASPDGARVYREVCRACHAHGSNQAPRLSDKQSWGLRLKQSYDTLLDHTLNGFNTMPAKGGAAVLSRQQVTAALDYMLAAVDKPETTNEAATSVQSTRESATRFLNTQLKGNMEYHAPPADESIPHDKYGDAVRVGKKIFTETYNYASRYTRNGLSCSNCHLDAGRRANAAPLWAAFGMYPGYKAKNDRNNSLEDRIRQCFKFSLNGFAPSIDSSVIRSLVAYAHFLSKGVPIGTEMPGRGFPQIVKTGNDPSPTRGGQSYLVYCARCHGENGDGREKDSGGYSIPPLWGFGSYNKAAGFAENDKLAGFIKANMPPGQEWSLSDQEALDIATYINLQIRPWDPRKGVIKGLFE